MAFHIQNLTKWKKHFEDMAHGKSHKKGNMFQVGGQSGANEKTVIKLFSPTEQTVQMASAELKRKSKTAFSKNKSAKKKKN